MTKNIRNTCMLCVSEFTLSSYSSEMVVASFRGRESSVNLDILMDTMARDRAHMYLFSV